MITKLSKTRLNIIEAEGMIISTTLCTHNVDVNVDIDISFALSLRLSY